MQRVTHKMCVEKHMLIDSGVYLIAFFASSKLVLLFWYRNSSKDQLLFLTNLSTASEGVLVILRIYLALSICQP